MTRFVIAGLLAALIAACMATVSQTCVPNADGGLSCTATGGVSRQ